jgi:hypothetical protein
MQTSHIIARGGAGAVLALGGIITVKGYVV